MTVQIDPSRGWAHPMALLIAGLIAVLLISSHRWWQEVHNPSPPPPEDEGQDDDTDVDLDDDTDGTEVIGYREERQPDGGTFVRYVRGRRRSAPDNEPETRDQAADRLVAGVGRYIDWVNDLRNQFGCSTSTAKRAIADAQKRLGRRS